MSWARVLNGKQRQALAVLVSSASPTSRLTGVNLATIKALAHLGLVDFPRSVLSDPIKDAGPNEHVRVTPGGFRAYADVVESADVLRYER